MSECTCHINPPCDYCTSYEECYECGRLFPKDELTHIGDIKFCEGCLECFSDEAEMF